MSDLAPLMELIKNSINTDLVRGVTQLQASLLAREYRIRELESETKQLKERTELFPFRKRIEELEIALLRAEVDRDSAQLLRPAALKGLQALQAFEGAANTMEAAEMGVLPYTDASRLVDEAIKVAVSKRDPAIASLMKALGIKEREQ